MPDVAALSVLVLAWDETVPAIRTVVAAAPAVGSLLVLLPSRPVASAPPATPRTTGPAALPLPVASPETEVSAASAEVVTVVTAAVLAEPAPPATASEVVPGAVIPVPIPTTALSPASSAAPQLAPPPVRLLHLVDTPPTLSERASAFRVPAAPYVGATFATSAAASAAALAAVPASAPTLLATAGQSVELASIPHFLLAAATEPEPPLGPEKTAKPTAAPAELAVTAAPTAEPAAATDTPTEAAPEGTVPALADAAFRADEILDPDPIQELQAAPLDAPAATAADSLALRDVLPAAHGPFGRRIPERRPVLAELALPPALAFEPAEEVPSPDEPAPPAPLPYTAPDLNTQVIRYARQAVPTALAEGPFDAIYAPAWPTWLAALELRQRSGRPLVLHLAALAAGRQPADTAAGWPAEIQRQALRQADLVLVETYALARRLRRELGLANSSVRVVPADDAIAVARALRRAWRPK